MKYVGIKQVTKNVKEGNVNVVYFAEDAEPHVTEKLLKICKEKKIKIVHVKTMKELGSMSNIDIGTSCAAE